MTWTGQTFTVGQILTAAQMTNLQADITAQANGDSGAPKQQTAGIADNAVTGVKMNDNPTDSGSGNLSPGFKYFREGITNVYGNDATMIVEVKIGPTWVGMPQVTGGGAQTVYAPTSGTARMNNTDGVAHQLFWETF